MDYSKFYTPPEIAQLLVKGLVISKPRTAIDICCGSCNLLRAVGKRWNQTELSGVDIAAHTTETVKFAQIDGREFAIQHPHRYPLVVANPPFDYVEKKKEFPDLYCGIFSKYSTKRLENEMLIANLLLLEKNGTLLIILPSTFVEASSNKNIRMLLGENYHIKTLIRLPPDTFGAANINSYALVIKDYSSRNRITKFCSVAHVGGEYSISEKIVIPQKNIRAGNWHAEMRQACGEELDIRRGNISSQHFCESGIPILHTAKENPHWQPTTRFTKENFETSVYADTGDIIVSRIGKSAGQWCQYRGERVAISDCLYRIKDPNGTIINRIEGNTFNLPQKGVATRYITIDDFASWYYSIAGQ